MWCPVENSPGKGVCAFLQCCAYLFKRYRYFKKVIVTGSATKNQEIFVVETAENGAGYTNYFNGETDSEIAKEVFIENLMENGSTYNILVKEDHLNCYSSCYDCLKDYYNQNLDLLYLTGH